MCKDPVAEETSNARAEGARAEWQEMTLRGEVDRAGPCELFPGLCYDLDERWKAVGPFLALK